MAHGLICSDPHFCPPYYVHVRTIGTYLRSTIVTRALDFHSGGTLAKRHHENLSESIHNVLRTWGVIRTVLRTYCRYMIQSAESVMQGGANLEYVCTVCPRPALAFSADIDGNMDTFRSDSVQYIHTRCTYVVELCTVAAYGAQ